MTERISIGLGIVNFYQHHPTLIAAEFAALDELAGGRVRLGIGPGIGGRGLAARPKRGPPPPLARRGGSPVPPFHARQDGPAADSFASRVGPPTDFPTPRPSPPP